MSFLPYELEQEKARIQKLAEQAGLDCFETIFELVDYQTLNQVASYGGFPVRYPHWRFGMTYEQLSKSYTYGLSKIYELVINTDPCYAYLLKGNSMLDQKLVMAHVYGHCDFFKNNYWFSKTNRKMIDVMANHATRIRRYMDRYGVSVVEDFIDVCLSLENLIDPYSVFVDQPKKVKKEEIKLELGPDKKTVSNKFKFDFPERDILKILMFEAPLKSWQQDVVSIIRAESYYFAPQMTTKIMNEGWASYWHSKLMTEKIMNDSEIINFAATHSGAMVMQPGSMNPYKVGIELFRDIKRRWDRGQYGREWEECDSFEERARWNKNLGEGEKKIFEVRKNHNDVTFIDEFLTEEFCVEHRMFVLKPNKKTGRWEVDSSDFKEIKKKLIFQLTNAGQPIVEAMDTNYEGKKGLYLKHRHFGIDMQPNLMKETIKNIHKVWKNPIWLETLMDEQVKIYKFDGKDFEEKGTSSPNEEKDVG